MTKILWTPDTCHCKVILDENSELVEWIQKCALHKTSKDFINDLKNHNTSFSLRKSTSMERNKELEANLNEKTNEKNRIRSLGEPILK